jgi:Na+/proline symporter
MVAAGAIGAIYGFSGLYHIFAIILFSFILVYYLSRVIYPDTIYEYLGKKIGYRFSAIYAIIAVILLLLWLSITVVLTSKLFLSLLGWNFVNSVFGLTLLTLICTQVGGYAGTKYNRGIWLTIITVAFILVVGLAIRAVSITSGIANLEQLAIDQGKHKDLYNSFNYTFHLNNIIGASISILVMLPLATAIKVSRRINSTPISLLKLVLFALMIFCGILAIETPARNITGSGNSKIVTYLAQLPDGQMGYIIKSVEASGIDAKNTVPGIVPPLLNEKTSLAETNKYDYKLANMVVFRHYLPAKLMFIVVLTIMAAYMYTLSNYLLAIAKIITVDICPPLNLLTQYGEDGKLWISRMSIVFAGGIAIFGGYFLQQWFYLIRLAYIVFSVAGVLALILLVVTAKNGKK